MSNPGERLRFTSITLKNWRNFADMTAALPRLGYLVGANGSGKSNLLDAFRFLHELGAVGGGLRAAVRNRGGMGSLRCAVRRLEQLRDKGEIGIDLCQ